MTSAYFMDNVRKKLSFYLTGIIIILLILLLYNFTESCSAKTRKAPPLKVNITNLPPLPTNADVTVENMILLHNRTRVQNKLPQFKVNDKLTKSAQLKLNDMIGNNYFAHISPTGATPWVFFQQAGYNYGLAAENLAFVGINPKTGKDFSDGFKIFDGFMDSPTHRENILNSEFTEIGIATDGKYIVIHFASPLKNF